jgi:hypothetical protein
LEVEVVVDLLDGSIIREPALEPERAERSFDAIGCDDGRRDIGFELLPKGWTLPA